MKQFLLFACFSSLFLLSLSIIQSCKADQLPDPDTQTFCDSITATYNASTKAIIDAKCAVSNCHGGPQGPNMSDFTAVSAVTDRIAVRALDQQTMPPAGQPQLTDEEISILNCWRNDGFPEQ